MSDMFNIEKIGKFINTEPEIEISDISKIIKSMINIKNNKEHIPSKKSLPYNILDKINLNCLSKNNTMKIKKYHNDNFDIIEDALDFIEDYEACIRTDLYDYYWNVYWDILVNLEIDYDDLDSIRINSNEIYTQMTSNIISELFEGKRTDIPSNRIVTYIEAITAYVFYKCKFLIPIEGII